MRNNKNVSWFCYGAGGIGQLGRLVDARRRAPTDHAVFLADAFFEGSELVKGLPLRDNDLLEFVSAVKEPTTDAIDALHERVRAARKELPCAVVGIGGGCVLDSAKALSNLLTNGGKARDYQGWDLVKVPGVYKIGVPTLSGTGAEASRTCVMTRPDTGLKLGMNSDFTIYDQLLLDPDLTRTVPRNQYMFTGLDSYIHCVESLGGSYRNAVGDAFSREALRLCREVFLAGDMMDDASREKLMVASYLGGCAIAHSFVGVVHPFSAGLSVVLGIHHGVGNVIALNALEEFYPAEAVEMRAMCKAQGVDIPRDVCAGLDEDGFKRLYQSTIIHEKPLCNALGDAFKDILTPGKVIELFKRM